jgi:hypothetical protein
LAVIVAELYLVNTGAEVLDDSSHLSSLKTVFRYVREESNYCQQFDLCHPAPHFHNT